MEEKERFTKFWKLKRQYSQTTFTYFCLQPLSTRVHQGTLGQQLPGFVCPVCPFLFPALTLCQFLDAASCMRILHTPLISKILKNWQLWGLSPIHPQMYPVSKFHFRFWNITSLLFEWCTIWHFVMPILPILRRKLQRCTFFCLNKGI